MFPPYTLNLLRDTLTNDAAIVIGRRIVDDTSLSLIKSASSFFICAFFTSFSWGSDKEAEDLEQYNNDKQRRNTSSTSLRTGARFRLTGPFLCILFKADSNEIQVYDRKKRPMVMKLPNSPRKRLRTNKSIAYCPGRKASRIKGNPESCTVFMARRL